MNTTIKTGKNNNMMKIRVSLVEVGVKGHISGGKMKATHYSKGSLEARVKAKFDVLVSQGIYGIT